MGKLTRKRKLAFFLGSLGSGGAERVISILSRHYAEKGYATDIAVLLFAGQFYEIDPSTRFLDFTGKGNSRWKRVPFWIRKIRAYVRAEKPDIIITFTARINALVLLACSGLGVRVIVSERNDPRFDGRGRIADLLTKFLYRYSFRVVFQTEYAMNYFPASVRKKGCIIYNPVAVDVCALPQKSKKIVNVGRLTSQKNQKMLLEAFKRLRCSHPDYELWIYGEGELRGELEAIVCDNGMQNSVFMPGTKKDIHEHIKDAEIFVLSSNFEGMSNALLEAMMMGLTVISTRCAGADEIIEDHVNGVLVPVGDECALAKAILHCIENPKEARELGENAKACASRFSVKTVFKQWDRLVDEALS